MNDYQTKTAQERLSELQKLNNSPEKIKQLQQLIIDFPDFILGWLELGLVYRRIEDYQSALTTFEKAIKLAPNNQKIKLELATAQLYCDRLTECRQNLEELLETNSEHVHTINKLGELYRKEEKHIEALQLFQKSLNINPQNLWTNHKIIRELIELNHLETAEQHLQRILQDYPNHFLFLTHLAILEQKRHNFDLSLQYLQKVICHYPHKIEPQLKILDILIELNRLDEIKVKLNILRQKYSNEFRIWIYSGNLEKKINQRKKALNWFKIAETKATNQEQKNKARFLVTQELIVLGRLDEANSKIDEIIQQFPDNLSAKILKGDILQKQSNLIAAVNLYKSIISSEPNHLKSRLELASTYSQLGQIEIAIGLLEETYHSLGADIQIFIQLGSLYQALEEWEIAAQWYQKAYQQYPEHPQVYCYLADYMYIRGEIDPAIQLLQEAQVKIPYSLPIIEKLIDLQLVVGNLELSHQLVKDAVNRFPNKVRLRRKLCRVQMSQGDYDAALATLDLIATDDQECFRLTQNLRANIYFHKYNYRKAEECLKDVISLTPVATAGRNRLATILMLTGRIDEARQELKLATEELKLKTSSGKTIVPLKSHVAMVTNALRINPPLMKKLQEVQQEKDWDRILALGSLLAQEPNYLGASLYLARELREQGIFDDIQQALSQNLTNVPTIPRRIVQFWDEPQPPQEVQRICQSWLTLNPEYEYTRFSVNTAVEFLQEHYDQQVLQAFANCNQPATQADFFRLAYLNKMGGFYADADDLCRQSLDDIVDLCPELVVLQEDFAGIGNNFLGCIPGQTMIRKAFYQAVDNLNHYCNDGPWFTTGPGLLTSVVCSCLVPYLTHRDYQVWPRLLVLTQAQLRKIINQHLSLSYKKTAKSWSQNAYRRKIKVPLVPDK